MRLGDCWSGGYINVSRRPEHELYWLTRILNEVLLVTKHPGCGNIVTFAPFLFIAVEGFLFEANLGRKQPAIPKRYYVVMVTMFFMVSVVNNYALNLNIAMPLHMIFISASTAAQISEQRLTVV